MSVTVEQQGDLAVVTIDNPPVNAASHAVRSGLVDAISQTETNDAIRAVVLCAAGATFTAGADVKEFGKPPQEPHLPDVILAMETVTKPWVAALHGNALGGGLEIALGCAYRIAQTGTKLGLPEVTLGLIPGAGGTVRLPRLIDPTEALKMIAVGKPINAHHAQDLGLVDEVTNGNIIEFACAMAQRVAGDALPLPISQRSSCSISDPAAWEKAASDITVKARGANAPIAAISAVENALKLAPNAALAHERAAFLKLKSDPQSMALRHIFFAERACSKLPELKRVTPNPLSTIGVIGGGTMGAGIAANCLLSGLSVVLIERDNDARAAGHDKVIGTLTSSMKRGLIDQKKFNAFTERFKTATNYSALSHADLVIEAVFEDMSVKHAVFAELDKIVPETAVLASNTSYLDINEIASHTKHPERVIGLHFFSPAHIMKLLEVILTDASSPQTRATGFALGKRLRKIAVPSGVCDGFIGNRIMSAYRRSCEEMIEDGAMPWDVDAAMRAFGFPMGIFEMQDLAGLDISWAMRKRQATNRDPNLRYVDLGDKLCEAGRFGRKSGMGWYDYADKTAMPSAWVETLILSEAHRKGVVRRSFTPDEITARILDSMQAEANALLAEGIAKRAEDIDVVMVNGYGFPRWQGGPMFLQTQSVET